MVVRIMRVVTANGYAKEDGEATYSGTPKTKAMTTTTSVTGIKLLGVPLPGLRMIPRVIPLNLPSSFDMNLQPRVLLPDFFKSNGYKNPTGAFQTAFQFAYNIKATYFEWMQQWPAIADTFNTLMLRTRDRRVHWLDWFPVEAELLNKAKDDARAVTMVDVRGGKGHDLMAFRAKFPDAPGRFIFQDQQPVLESVNAVMGNTEAWAYDLFTPQPVKDQFNGLLDYERLGYIVPELTRPQGARLYFMYYILHNWDDESFISDYQKHRVGYDEGIFKAVLERMDPS